MNDIVALLADKVNIYCNKCNQKLQIDQALTHVCGNIIQMTVDQYERKIDQIKIQIYENIIKSNVNFPQIISNDNTKKKSLKRSIKAEPVIKTEKKYDLSKDELQQEIYDKISKLTNTSPKRNHTDIRNLRLRLMALSNYKDYMMFTQQTLKTITTKFSDLRSTKIPTIISNTLSSIDLRLIDDLKYSYIPIIVEEIAIFKSMITSQSSKDILEPFSMNTLYDSLFNYGIIFFPLKERLIQTLCSTKNIICIQKNTNLYYTLTSISDNKFMWTLDAHLETLCNDLIVNIKQYLVENFKKIYFHVFKHNNFIDLFIDTNPVFSLECHNILKSLSIISKPLQFFKLIQEIISTHSSHNKTINDVFNLTFQSEEETEPNVCNINEIIKSLFDKHITVENVEYICSTYTI